MLHAFGSLVVVLPTMKTIVMANSLSNNKYNTGHRVPHTSNLAQMFALNIFYSSQDMIKKCL